MNQAGKRVYAVDLARGLAVFFMILVHVLITNGNSEVEHSLFGEIIDRLGETPAAPVFMATMGISFYYSRNTELMAGIKRGLYIILLGYVLNFFRGVLPVFLIKLLAPSMAAGIPEAVANYYDVFMELDILHFAGLSLIVMAVFRELKVNKYFFLLLAGVVAIVSPILWGIHVNTPVLDHLLDYLWGDKPSPVECIGNLVSFPFFPWFFFVLIGMFLGQTLVTSADPNKTFKFAGIIGSLILIVSSIIIDGNFGYQMNDYYHSRPGFVFLPWALS